MNNTLKKMLVCMCVRRGDPRDQTDLLGRRIEKSSPHSEIATIYFPVCHLVYIMV